MILHYEPSVEEKLEKAIRERDEARALAKVYSKLLQPHLRSDDLQYDREDFPWLCEPQPFPLRTPETYRPSASEPAGGLDNGSRSR